MPHGYPRPMPALFFSCFPGWRRSSSMTRCGAYGPLLQLAISKMSNQMRKNMKMSVVVLCVLAGMEAQEASAAIRLKHIPPCPEGVVEKKVCRCRAFVSHRYDVCVAGQHCLRNAFHGMCL